MAVTIGRAIKIIREANGKPLGELAMEANVSIPYLSLIEGDKRTPSIEVINRVAFSLGVPPEIFILIGSGSKTTLMSRDKSTEKLIAIIKQMEGFEKRIRDAIGQQGC